MKAPDLSGHREVITDFVRFVESLPADAWGRPRGPGKWTPAEEVTHVAMVYEALVRELEGGTPMRRKGNAWQRAFYRVLAKPYVLGRGRIPRAVRAPSEVRPVEVHGGRTEAMARLREAVLSFEATLSRAARERPRVTVTHPFFGELTLAEAARFVEVHTGHHLQLLEASLVGA